MSAAYDVEVQPASEMPAEGRREPVRTGLAAAAALCAIVLATFAGSAAVGWWQHRQGVGLSAQGAAGIAVSPDTSLAVTTPSDGDGLDLVWRLGEHPDLVGRFPGGGPVTFAPDGRTVIAASADGAAAWSLADPGHPARIAALPGPGPVRGIAYAPDQVTVAIAHATAVQLWNMADASAPSPIGTLPVTAEAPDPWAHVDYQAQVAFSPDGHMLAVNASAPAAGPTGPAVSLWDISTPGRPALLATLDLGASIAALEFSPIAPQLAGLARDGTITVYDITDPTRPARAVEFRNPRAAHIDWTAYALGYSLDGTRLAAVVVTDDPTRDRSVCVWDVNAPPATATACRTDEIQGSGAITFTTDRTAVVGPDLDGADTVTVWPTPIGSP